MMISARIDRPYDRPTLVFLHGFLGSHRDFIPLATELAQLGQYNCLLMDLPGHGGSLGLPEATYSFSGAAEAIVTKLDHYQIHQPILYGYSMGGRLALYLALHQPDRFSQAFLESTSPGLETPELQRDRRQQDAKLAQALQTDFPKFLQSWYRTELFRSLSTHPDFPNLLDRRYQNNPKELARSLQGMGTGSQDSLWGKLFHAQIPLMLIVGTKDPKFCVLNQKMLDLCPIAQLYPIANAGHNLHIEAPQSILTLLQNPQ